MIEKKTKIICTLGPSSDNQEIIEGLVENGMNIARLNFSHGTHESHQKTVDLLRKIQQSGKKFEILLDTKGPEVRVGALENDMITLEKCRLVRIAYEDVVGNSDRFSVSYKGLYDDVKIGTILRIDDGKLALEVVGKENHEIVCEVKNSYKLKKNKSVCVPYTTLHMDFINEKDEADLKFACDNHLDYIAASFTRSADDVIQLKNILKKYGGENIKVIAKIENQDGIDNLDAILDVADGVMVARGDLGGETAFEEVPVFERLILKKAKEHGKFSIVATQMLESMIENPAPTRAEVNDVATAVYLGSDAVMLSGESASGKYPLEACLMQAKIVARIEKEL